MQREKDEPHADLFNRAVTKESGDYFIFLGKDFDFSHGRVVEDLVELMGCKRLIGFGGAYSDLYVMDDKGVLVCNRFNPAYDIRLIQQGMAMNLPFIVSARHGLPRFTEGLDVLSLWDGVIQIMVSSPMYHIPSPWFTLRNVLSNVQVEDEIKLINDTHYS